MADWSKLTAGVQKRALGVFWTPVLYRVGGVDPSTELRGIYRAESYDAQVDLEVAGAAVAPELHVRESDLPAGALAAETDTVELTEYSETWRVRDFEPDGEGMLRLVLTVTD